MHVMCLPKGYVPGLCHATNLTVGHRYLILANLHDGIYRPNYAEPADTDEQLANLTVACGLKQLYPKDVNANKAIVKCPTTAPSNSCKSKQDFQSSGTVTLPTKNDNDDYYDPDDDDSTQSVHVGKSTYVSAGRDWHHSSSTAFVASCVVLARLFASAAAASDDA